MLFECEEIGKEPMQLCLRYKPGRRAVMLIDLSARLFLRFAVVNLRRLYRYAPFDQCFFHNLVDYEARDHCITEQHKHLLPRQGHEFPKAHTRQDGPDERLAITAAMTSLLGSVAQNQRRSRADTMENAAKYSSVRKLNMSELLTPLIEIMDLDTDSRRMKARNFSVHNSNSPPPYPPPAGDSRFVSFIST